MTHDWRVRIVVGRFALLLLVVALFVDCGILLSHAERPIWRIPTLASLVVIGLILTVWRRIDRSGDSIVIGMTHEYAGSIPRTGRKNEWTSWSYG